MEQVAALSFVCNVPSKYKSLVIYDLASCSTSDESCSIITVASRGGTCLGLESPCPNTRYGHYFFSGALAFNRDASKLLLNIQTSYLLNTSDLSVLSKTDGPGYIDACFSPDDTQIAVVWGAGIRLLSSQDLGILVSAGFDGVSSVDFSPDSASVLIGTSSGLRILSALDLSQIALYEVSGVKTVKYSSDGIQVVAACGASGLLLFSGLDLAFLSSFTDDEDISRAVFTAGYKVAAITSTGPMVFEPSFTGLGSTSLTLSRVSIARCTAQTGGAVALSAPDVTFTSVDSSLRNNDATGDGGAIAISGERVVAHISRGVLAENSAREGGALKMTAGSLVLIHSDASANQATSNGGAAVVSNAQLTVFESTVYNNVAHGKGGAAFVTAYAGEGTTVDLVRVAIDNNFADSDGGAIDCSIADGTTGVIIMNLTNSTVAFNGAGNNGGALNAKRCNIGLNGVKLSSNAANNNGGGLSVVDSAVVVHANSSLTVNRATGDGGALSATNSRVTLSHASLTLNSAVLDGGAVQLVDSTLEGEALELLNNSANDGAAIVLHGSSDLVLSDTYISGNSAVGVDTAVVRSVDSARFDLRTVHFLLNHVTTVLVYTPEAIAERSPTLTLCVFAGNGEVATVHADQPVVWTCRPGQYGPQTGVFYGDFDGCPLLCAIGHYGTMHNATDPGCSGPCPPGNFCVQGGSAPAACPAGTTNPSVGLSSEGSCLPCIPGTHSPSLGSTNASCAKCPAGKFSARLRQTACDPCPPGGSCADAGAFSAMVWQPCVPGTYSNASGLVSPMQCTNCPRGSANPRRGSTLRVDCERCPAGRYADARGMPNCAACAPGKFQPSSNQTMCLGCEPGYFCSKGATAGLPVGCGTSSLPNTPHSKRPVPADSLRMVCL